MNKDRTQPNQFTVTCNHAAYKPVGNEHVHVLSIFGGKGEPVVHPKVEMFKDCLGELTPRLVDFLELASYIYTIDQIFPRCQCLVDPYGVRWRRDIKMIMAVQDIDFWGQEKVRSTLMRLLRFLSDDLFDISFVKMTAPHPEQMYFTFNQDESTSDKVERVMLFSGGLDSLGGAVQSLIAEGKRTVLVRHRSTHKFVKRFNTIKDELEKLSLVKPEIIPIDTSKSGIESKEYTQRCRSFLYFTLGSIFAIMLKVPEVNFYENGPISLNLPLSPQVIGGRATRTTHPQTLHFFQELIRLISGNPDFKVTNPFLYKTKADIIRLIIQHGCGHLVKESMSCAHSWEQKLEHAHCGLCSQCVDRRVAIIAADAMNLDNPSDYKYDLFTSSLDKGKGLFDMVNKNLITSYFLRGQLIAANDYSYDKFEMDNPTIYDATPYMEGGYYKAARDIYALYKSLAHDIVKVEQYAMSPEFAQRVNSLNPDVPEDSLFSILTRRTRQVLEIRRREIVLPEYCFYREGGGWFLRCGVGRGLNLQNYVGFRYINKMLAEPNREFSVDELFPPPLASKPSIEKNEQDKLNGGNAPLAAKEDYLRIKMQIDAKENELDRAREENNSIECLTLKEEIDGLYEQLDSISFRGKVRKLPNTYEKKRAAIRKAIKDAIEIQLATQMPEMCKLLFPAIPSTGPFIYKPSSPIAWTLKRP